MTIHIENLTFDVIIGLLDFERDRPQRIIIDLKASYKYTDNHFINYADIVSLIKEKLKTQRYELLEDALLELKEILYITYPNIEELYIKIAKPDILTECSVALSHTWHF
ncbi:Dihydroneopterin aldolase [hydrothermal vent metagenome]|uniref:Dihydroneopterin aldolase n=1 Tax=hydrothermal vent metagenome TaxID=652676 RepID=A0A1W1CU21_9ZZZZ